MSGAAPTPREAERPSRGRWGAGQPYFPGLALKEALAALALLGALVLVAALTRPTLEAAADAGATGYAPRPEWYFLWLFQLLKYFGGRLEVVGVVFLPAALVLLLLAVPFLDRREPRLRTVVPGGRPVRVVPRVIAAVFVVALLTLTVLGATTSSGSPGFLGPQQPAPQWPPPAAVQGEPAP